MLYQLSYVRAQRDFSLARRAPGSARREYDPLGRSSTETHHASRRRAEFRALASGVRDHDRRADVHVLDQPLGVRDVHADAAVRGGIADRGVVWRPVDPDALSRQAHPPRAEGVARPGRDRLEAARPRGVGRPPPRPQLHVDDRELTERRGIDRLARGDAERAGEVAADVVAELVHAASDHDHGPERRARHLRSDRSHCDPHTAVLREPQRAHEPLERRIHKDLAPGGRVAELRHEILDACHRRVLRRIREALVEPPDVRARRVGVDPRLERDRSKLVRVERARNAVCDSHRRAEASRSEPPVLLAERDAHRLREGRTHRRGGLLEGHASDRNAGQRHTLGHEDRGRRPAAEHRRGHGDDDDHDQETADHGGQMLLTATAAARVHDRTSPHRAASRRRLEAGWNTSHKTRTEGQMPANDLHETAKALVAEGKGILAADESEGTIKKRFDSIGVESTEMNRGAYRELLFTTEGVEEDISGVILFDETIRQSASDGTPFPKLLESKGVIPGIKVDKGAKPLALAEGETITEGLDGLRGRLEEYRGLGARCTKWRAVLSIGKRIPSEY